MPSPYCEWGVCALICVFSKFSVLGPTTNVYRVPPPACPAHIDTQIHKPNTLPQSHYHSTLPTTILLNAIKASPPGVCIVNQA